MIKEFISLIYPNYCVVSGEALVRGEEYISTAVRLNLPYTEHHLEVNNPLKAKFRDIRNVMLATAYLKYTKNGYAQKILQELKYNNNPTIGEMLGRWYGSVLKGHLFNIDYLVPVPLHWRKQRTRGYNQSEKIALGLSQSLDLTMRTDILKKELHNTSQTKKSKLARNVNVMEAYRVVNEREVAGKDILIVDDVITTGATVAACCHALNDKGCGSISIVAIAMA